MNKPIVLRTANIYLRFPEIMEEEYIDLAEFLEDEHIVYEGATDIFIEKDKEIERLSKDVDMWNRKYNEQFNIITELEKYINKEFCVVGDSPEGSFFEGYDTCLIEMKKEILDKLKELKEGR